MKDLDKYILMVLLVLLLKRVYFLAKRMNLEVSLLKRTPSMRWWIISEGGDE